MRVTRTLKLLWAFSKAEIQEAMTYRLGGLAWVINGSITSLLMMYIWTLVTTDHSQIVTYFLGIIFISRLTGSWSFGDIAERIKDGSLSQTLLKPYHYMFEIFAHDMGAKLNRLISMVPYIIILGFIFSSNLSLPSLSKIIISVPAILAGYSIEFLFGITLGLLTNWTGDADGIGRLYETVSNLASGYLVPFFLMPILLRSVLDFTPFRYFVSFPIEILQNKLSPGKIILGYSILTGWITLLILLFKLMDRTSMKSFSAHGN